jgi:hypothetical protein
VAEGQRFQGSGMIDLAKWAERSLLKVGRWQPQTIHIDELCDYESVDDCLAVLGRLGALVGDRGVSCLLVLPLPSAPFLATVCPELSDIKVRDVDEPPTVAIVSGDSRALAEVGEDYRRTVSAPAGLPDLDGLEWWAYYRCYRNGEAMRHGWEFERMFCIELISSSLVTRPPNDLSPSARASKDVD